MKGITESEAKAGWKLHEELETDFDSCWNELYRYLSQEGAEDLFGHGHGCSLLEHTKSLCREIAATMDMIKEEDTKKVCWKSFTDDEGHITSIRIECPEEEKEDE